MKLSLVCCEKFYMEGQESFSMYEKTAQNRSKVMHRIKHGNRRRKRSLITYLLNLVKRLFEYYSYTDCWCAVVGSLHCLSP